MKDESINLNILPSGKKRQIKIKLSNQNVSIIYLGKNTSAEIEIFESETKILALKNINQNEERK